MTFKDRTNEFHAVFERIRLRSHQSVQERRALISSSPSSRPESPKPNARSEFSLMAAEISRKIIHTQGKLEKLTALAKRKTLFDDKPIEINELTFIIKKDIAELNSQISLLQEYTKHQKQSSKQANEHSSNVVMSLQNKLADASIHFKDALEIRTENMLQSKQKRDQFLFSASEQALNVRSRRGKAQENPHMISQDDTEESAFSLGIPMLSQEQQLQQQQMVALEQENYIESRSRAIESIESTIAELGGMFQQLATMIAEQRETVQRIDQDTEDIEMNIMGAQRELLKYYINISSNRWLMIKIFATVVFFFMIFVFIM